MCSVCNSIEVPVSWSGETQYYLHSHWLHTALATGPEHSSGREDRKDNGPIRVLPEGMTVVLILIFSALPKIQYRNSINVYCTSKESWRLVNA